MISERQYILTSPPADGITNLCYSGNYHLLASSWDGSVRLYNTTESDASEHLVGEYAHKAAVLDCTFVDRFKAASGGLSRHIKLYDFNTNTEEAVGTHDDAVRCLNFAPEQNALLSAGWDAKLKMWDLRSRVAQTFDLPGKAYTMDCRGDRLVVGTADRHVWIYDVRDLSEPLQKRTSTLKFQTRVVRVFTDVSGYTLGSIEGRVSVEYFDLAEDVQAKKYAFKCHRAKENGQDIVYPVNAIAFHPTFGTFATGGCDRTVNVWDGKFKKRIHQSKGFPTSIASLAFNADGSQLAIASSYTFEEGEKTKEPDQIYVRLVKDNEVQPRPSKGK
eukprot:TRINITY_DN523_c2_g1_i1.p1 TRINITY_DN523_c2_g1~~TRINITY_DN523_c2_g1_i1.p1  ORF type:complete len:362 (+),score=82.25 TRINITY_DN523_c2_g1_i1:95-1087(+)